jgi:hypothetical protein
MKKNIVIASIIVLISFFTVSAASAMDYQHQLEATDITFSWSLDGDKIHVKLAAKTTGWVGIGFNPETAMAGANIIIGAVKGEKFKVEDHFGDRKRNHASDESLGGVNNVENPAGEEKDGVTTISFTYPLKTDDKWDSEKLEGLSTEKPVIVMLAYGRDGKDKMVTNASHQYRTIYEVNLSTGENKKIK